MKPPTDGGAGVAGPEPLPITRRLIERVRVLTEEYEPDAPDALTDADRLAIALQLLAGEVVHAARSLEAGELSPETIRNLAGFAGDILEAVR